MASDGERGPDAGMSGVSFALCALVVVASVSPFASQLESSTRDGLFQAENLTSTSPLPTVNGSTPFYSTSRSLNITQVSNSSEAINNNSGNFTTILSALLTESGDRNQSTQSTQSTTALVDEETQFNSSSPAAETTESTNLTASEPLTDNSSHSTATSPSIDSRSTAETNSTTSATNGRSPVETTSTTVGPNNPGLLSGTASTDAAPENISTPVSTPFSTNTDSRRTGDKDSTVWVGNASTPSSLSTESVDGRHTTTNTWLTNDNSSVSNVPGLTSPVQLHNSTTHEWTSANTSDLTSQMGRISTNDSDLTSPAGGYNLSSTALVSTDDSHSTPEYNMSSAARISTNTADLTSPGPQSTSMLTSTNTTSVPQYNTSPSLSTNHISSTPTVTEHSASSRIGTSTDHSASESTPRGSNISTSAWTENYTSNSTSTPAGTSTNNAIIGTPVPGYNTSTPTWVSTNASDSSAPEYNASTPHWRPLDNSGSTPALDTSTPELSLTDSGDNQRHTSNAPTTLPDLGTGSRAENSTAPSQVTAYNPSSTVSTRSGVERENTTGTPSDIPASTPIPPVTHSTAVRGNSSTPGSVLTNSVDNNTRESTTDLSADVTSAAADVSSSLRRASSTARGGITSNSVSTGAAHTTNATVPSSQPERSFEGVLRVVSIGGADAIYDAPLDYPDSFPYKYLKASVEEFVDGVYETSALTRRDYLGSTVRRFRNGSVVVDFGSRFRPASTVTAATLETLMSAASESMTTDIEVDPSATRFEATNECELGIDDCSVYAACEDLGADGYTCHCQQGTTDMAGDTPGRLCIHPNTTGAQTTGSTVATSVSTVNDTMPGTLPDTPGTANAHSTTTEAYDSARSTTDATPESTNHSDNASNTTNAQSTSADSFDNASTATIGSSSTTDKYDTSSVTNALTTTADEADNISGTTDALAATPIDASGEVSTVSTGVTSVDSTSPAPQGRSFEGAIRIVSFRGQDAVFNSSLEDPGSSFYKQLKFSVENFIDSVFNASALTRDDYLGCAVRDFSSGSVVANFGALLRPASTVTGGDLEAVSTAVLAAENGTVPGADITVDLTATTFKATTVTQAAQSTPAVSTLDSAPVGESTVPAAPPTTSDVVVTRERSFEGVLRVVSFRGAEAAYNSSLEVPGSPFYQQLKESVERFVDGIYKLSGTTRDDYLGSAVRRFRNGSVVVDFVALFRPASTVGEGDLESLATTVLKATGGTVPGTDITVEPAVITFAPTDECALGIDDCSMHAVCEDTGAGGFSCQCLPGTIDAEAGTRPGRLCISPTTAKSSVTMTTQAVTEEEEGEEDEGEEDEGEEDEGEEDEEEDDPPAWAGWQIGIFVLGITIGILIVAAVFHRLASLRNYFRSRTEDPERRDERAPAERPAYRDRSWSFMYRRPEAEGTPDPDRYADGGLGGDLLPANGQTVAPSAPPETEGDSSVGTDMNETGVQTDPVPGESLTHRVGGDGIDGQAEDTNANGHATSTAKESGDSTSVTVEGEDNQDEAKGEAESTSDGCIVM